MTTATQTLTDFLLARIAEDEQGARDDGADAMTGARWKHYPPDAYEELRRAVLDRCRRIAAECEAKRRVVERHNEDDSWSYGQPCETLRLLALPYADHPDYDESWRSVSR